MPKTTSMLLQMANRQFINNGSVSFLAKRYATKPLRAEPAGLPLATNNSEAVDSCNYRTSTIIPIPDNSEPETKRLWGLLSNHIGSKFMNIHKNEAPTHLSTVKNIIIYHGGLTELWKKDTSGDYNQAGIASTAAAQDVYKVRKNLSHLAVSINVLASSFALVADEDSFSRIHAAAGSMFGTLGLLPKSIQTEYALLIEASASALLRLAASTSSRMEVADACRKYNGITKIILQEYAKESAQVQIISLENIMDKWTQEHHILPEDTKALIVVAHGPRQKLLETQYFEQWGKGKLQIFPVEMLPAQMSSINVKKDLILGFLAEQLLNQQIGKRMLDDENAMFKDILAPYAEEILEKFPSKEEGCPYLNHLKKK